MTVSPQINQSILCLTRPYHHLYPYQNDLKSSSSTNAAKHGNRLLWSSPEYYRSWPIYKPFLTHPWTHQSKSAVKVRDTTRTLLPFLTLPLRAPLNLHYLPAMLRCCHVIHGSVLLLYVLLKLPFLTGNTLYGKEKLLSIRKVIWLLLSY